MSRSGRAERLGSQGGFDLTVQHPWCEGAVDAVEHEAGRHAARGLGDYGGVDVDGEAGINSLMVRRADRVIVVTTGDKVGKRSFARICMSSAIHVLVADQTAPRPSSKSCGPLGSRLLSPEAP